MVIVLLIGWQQSSIRYKHFRTLYIHPTLLKHSRAKAVQDCYFVPKDSKAWFTLQPDTKKWKSLSKKVNYLYNNSQFKKCYNGQYHISVK